MKRAPILGYFSEHAAWAAGPPAPHFFIVGGEAGWVSVEAQVAWALLSMRNEDYLPRNV